MTSIAEMKARMASRMNRNQGRNNYNNNYNDYDNNAVARDEKKSAPVGTVVKEVSIPHEGISIRNLSMRMSMTIDTLKGKLLDMGETIGSSTGSVHRKGKVKGINANVNLDGVDEAEQIIDADIAELVVLEMGIEAKRESDASNGNSDRDRDRLDEGEEALATEPRAPVVCVMGHVDHGKTTLLDALRSANVADNEAGGITQKLSAFRVDVGGRQVAFLDTPGHAAFSTMRSHGVCATDLVVLVVAIDDGVKSQTREALRCAKDAGCTIVVAITKCDKVPPGPARETAKSRIYAQLSEEDLVCEEFGGDVMAVEVSAQSGENLASGLVEGLMLQADMMELVAATEGQCEAVVLDANMEKGRGVVADVLVRWGKLEVGDAVIVDTTFGRVKAMVNDQGKNITSAGPSTPVRLLGLRSVPNVGQEMLSVESEAKAKGIVDRRVKLKEARDRLRNSSVDGGSDSVGESEIGEGGIPTLPVFLKADGVGTLEALEKIVEGLDSRTEDINLVVVKSGVGDVNRSEVEAAATAGARVLGFNVGIADSATRSSMKELGVVVERDTIIYRLEESLTQAMQSLMPKERKEVPEGTAVVQQIFQLRDKQSTSVAGLMVRDGKLSTSAGKSGSPLVFKVTRKGFTSEEDLEESRKGGKEDEEEGGNDRLKGVVFTELEVNSGTAQLKRFKDVVHTVDQGNDCGLVLNKFKDWQEGDVVHCFRVEYETKRLSLAAPASSA
jgi:translation initiation factor IF-2